MNNILLFIIIVIIVGVIMIASPFVNTVRTLPEYQNNRLKAVIFIFVLLLIISLGIYGYLTGERHWWLGLLAGILWIVFVFERKRQEKKKRSLKKGKEIKNI